MRDLVFGRGLSPLVADRRRSAGSLRGVEHRERQLRRGSAHGGGEAAHLGIVAVLGDRAQPRGSRATSRAAAGRPRRARSARGGPPSGAAPRPDAARARIDRVNIEQATRSSAGGPRGLARQPIRTWAWTWAECQRHGESQAPPACLLQGRGRGSSSGPAHSVAYVHCHFERRLAARRRPRRRWRSVGPVSRTAPRRQGGGARCVSIGRSSGNWVWGGSSTSAGGALGQSRRAEARGSPPDTSRGRTRGAAAAWLHQRCSFTRQLGRTAQARGRPEPRPVATVAPAAAAREVVGRLEEEGAPTAVAVLGRQREERREAERQLRCALERIGEHRVHHTDGVREAPKAVVGLELQARRRVDCRKRAHHCG